MKKINLVIALVVSAFTVNAHAGASNTKVLNVSIPAYCLEKAALGGSDISSAALTCTEVADTLHRKLIAQINCGKIDHELAQDVFQIESVVRQVAQAYLADLIDITVGEVGVR